ncbi:CheF family chemotaxis protein [Haloarculaceae archaeon H-GB2-1]|nr:CheF family chemotaxis protein [Haloarculaceae archaeon H-GB1-1]MEA5406477.1 CheF family chemotaxis protein [Haloarculaceae archaeon H-GB2-1]
MSDSEKKIRDTQGKFLQAVKDGKELRDGEWQECRVVLTNKRLVLVADGKTSVPLSNMTEFGGRYDKTQAAAQESNYTAVTVSDDVYLVSTTEHSQFETDLYKAVLNGQVLFVDHPAVKGGVVQGTEWTKARIKVGDSMIRLAVANGDLVEIDRDDIGDVDEDERTVEGEDRLIVEVEHTEDDISVETHITGTRQHITVLRELVQEGVERTEADLDLSNTEKQVIMALHSGVSPFAIPDFVGISVEKTEAIYDRLIELDVIEVTRERTEVEITPQGRNVAGKAMASQ